MTTASANLKNVGYPLPGARTTVQVRYDFAVDGGATGVLQMMKAQEDLVVTDFHIVCTAACTSGGSATVSIGTTTDTTKFVGATAGAVANLTLAAVLGVDASENIPYRWKSGDYLIITIGTAALTAGVIDITLEVMKT